MPTALVIESEVSSADALKELLSDRGVDMLHETDGMSGLRAARTEGPDVIVLNVELAKRSGYSICNKLKKDGDLAAIPLILTSSQATDETFERHKKLPTRAEAYLKKPYSDDEILELIAEHVPLKGASHRASKKPAEEVIDVSPAEFEPEPTGVDLGGSDELTALLESSPRVSKKAVSSARRATGAGAGDGEIERLRKENQALRQKNQKLEKQLADRELEFNDRLLEESSKGREASAAKKQVNDMRRENERLQEDLAQAQQRVAQAEADLAAARSDASEGENERQLLADKLQQLVEKARELAADRDAMQDKLDQVVEERHAAQSQVEGTDEVRKKARKAVDIAMKLLDETGLV